MFNADYFRNALPSQIRGIGGNPVVKIVLRSGQELLVRNVKEAADGWLMLNLYPPDEAAGIVTSLTTSYSGLPKGGYYPGTIAYETIAQVYLSSTTTDQKPRIGFVEE